MSCADQSGTLVYAQTRRPMNIPDNKRYLTTAEAAKLLGMSTARARNWLRRAHVTRKIGGRFYVTLARLKAAFPEAFDGTWSG